MSYNEAETRFYLIDPVLRGKGYNEHWKLKLETPAPVEPTGAKGRRRPGAGRTDYLLCVQVGALPKPLPIAVIEAKAETDPLKGMQQAKEYADCKRFQVHMCLPPMDIGTGNSISQIRCQVAHSPSLTFQRMTI